MVKTERKKQILYCAESLFAEKGYYSTSISDIIQEAGVARGTFYQYFDNKKTIFDALIDDLFEIMDRSIKRIDPLLSEPSPLEQLKENMYRVFSILNKKKNLTKILITYATGIDADFDHKIHTFYHEIVNTIESALSLGIEMEILRLCNTNVVACCILGCVKEVAFSLIFKDYTDENIEEIADEVIQFGLTGLLIQ